MRFAATGMIALAIAIGAVVATGGGGGGGSPSGAVPTANIFVAQNGSDSGGHCTRSSSLISDPDTGGTTDCLTFDKANQLAQTGDVIAISCGGGTSCVYPGQEIINNASRSPSCDRYGSTNPTGCVTYAAEQGDSPQVGQHTTVTSGLTVPSGAFTLTVGSTTGFDLSKTIDAAKIPLTCTGSTSTTFTGCTFSFGHCSAGGGDPCFIGQVYSVGDSVSQGGLKFGSDGTKWVGVPINGGININTDNNASVQSNRICPSDVWIDQTNIIGGAGGYLFLQAKQNIALTNDDFGWSYTGSSNIVGFCQDGTANAYNWTLTNVLFNHDTFHDEWVWVDAAGGPSSDHAECMKANSVNPVAGPHYTYVSDHVMLLNSRFYNCASYDMYLSAAVDNSGDEPNHWTIANTFFGVAYNRVITGGTGGVIQYGGFQNLQLLFDVWEQIPNFVGPAGNYGGTNYGIGNIFDATVGNAFSSCSNATQTWYGEMNSYYNMADSGSPCAGHTDVVGAYATQLPNASSTETSATPNFHLGSCAVTAANLVPNTVPLPFPSPDFYGTARPSNNADAGVSEDC